ncbi:DUF3037 domain-containing protein [Paludibacteraceae bacterium OttesenSCG-928-F17]|nr:DUF3037 domain-containing protein [Paludibacteraceae bacterium OttesenSCG-928-F17]
MQEKNLYEYAVIRVVPKIEREEFLNVGIILFSKKAKFIKMLYRVNEDKLMKLSDDADFEYIRETLESFEKIANGHKDGGAIAQMDIPERFRWLTAVRSSCIQTSRPHSGFSTDLNKTTEKLFEELVL